MKSREMKILIKEILKAVKRTNSKLEKMNKLVSYCIFSLTFSFFILLNVSFIVYFVNKLRFMFPLPLLIIILIFIFWCSWIVYILCIFILFKYLSNPYPRT